MMGKDIITLNSLPLSSVISINPFGFRFVYTDESGWNNPRWTLWAAAFDEYIEMLY